MSYIPYGKQDISDDDIASVVSVLRSEFLTQGPKVPEFENALSNFCGSKHAIAVNSATSALHIACLALGLEKGDFLWTSPITFVASANCGLYCGAKVDFVDIDEQTYNISVKALQKKLIQAKALGTLPKVVIPVHLTGQPCDMKGIHALAIEYGFKIIEDASHAVGGTYQNLPIGNCKYSDITVFSFHPVKIITTTEGGAAITNNADLASKMNLLRSHGITRDENYFQKKSDGPWYYEQISLGYNYRMTDLQAALGISQLKRVDEFIKRRHELAKRYNEMLAALPLITPFQIEEGYSAFHLYVIRIENRSINKTHLEVFEAMRSSGVGVNLHYIPVYRQPYYQEMGYDPICFPCSEKYYHEAMSLPIFYAMSFEEQNQVVSALKLALGL